MKKVVPAVIFRMIARKAMKPVMSILILVMLIAMAPSLVNTAITKISGSDIDVMYADLYTEERVTAMMSEDAAVSAAAGQEIMDGLAAFLRAKWPFLALTAAITLVMGPVLTLGFQHTLLKALRKEEIAVSTVFDRMPQFFKAIGLILMIWLRMFLWMLPGTAAMLLGFLLSLYVPLAGMLLMIAGMVLMLVLTIRAAYRYRLATYVMADTPETGVNAAIRRSAEVMKGRKMELFSLEISFMGWRLLLSLAQMTILGAMGPVIGSTLSMFASFFLSMYVYMAEAAFYQTYAVGPLNADGPDGTTQEMA